jgi:zeta-carotene desaturase
LSPDPDAVVIGGGFAGLSAATMLAERGRRVLVLEARPTLGGRATAFTDPATGERVDNGQHVLIGGYHETFRFLRRIGAEGDVYLQPTLAIDFVDRRGVRSRLSCPALPAPLHLLAGVLTWTALSWRDRAAVLRLGSALRYTAAPTAPVVFASHASHESGTRMRREESETVREWLGRRGQTPRAIELLWEPLAVAALNEPIDRASAAPFVEVLRRMFGTGARDAALALPRKPLDDLYAAPARRFIEARGGTVRVNAQARIRCRSGQPEVEVRDGRVPTRCVICAVPWYALADTLVDPPEALRHVISNAEGTAASPIVTVNLWFDRAVTERPFLGLPGRAMQWVFDKRLLFGEDTSHLSLVSSGADAIVARTNDELVALAMDELTSALPEVRDATLRRAVVVRERRATFSVAPGQPARPSTVTGVPGLYLAGDWIDTGLPATIESAVMSGHGAADAASRDS